MSVKYVGYRLAKWLSTILSPAAAFACAERLADLRWRCAADDRAAVETNLSVLLGGELPEQPRFVREVFRNFGRYLVEFFTIQRIGQPQVTVDGYDHLVTALNRRRGVIVLTAHLGNWEVGAALIRRMGHPVAAVALPHADPQMDRLFNRQRQRCGIEVIGLGRDAVRRSLQTLQAGRLLGILGDREFADNGLPLPFGGGMMTLPKGPALLSLRGRAPIVPTFLMREGSWRFRLCFEPPIWPPLSDRGAGSLRMLIRSYAASIERYVKRFPEQWLMFRPALTTVS